MWVAVLSLLLATASQAAHLSGIFGEFSSPGHPLAYPALASQSWDISAPEGYIIKLYVPYLDIEFSDGCQSSFLQVQSEGEQLARLCGTRKGEDPALYEYYSSTNSMRALFQANSSSSRPFSGFLALYSRVGIWLNIKQSSLSPVLSVSNAAGDPANSDIMGLRLVAFGTLLVLIALSPPVSGSDDPGLFGEIRLPNYHPEERLSWEVAVSPGFGLRLQLQHYDSERSSPCRHNYVEVYADRERLGRFCGNTTSSRFHQPFPSASGTDLHTVRLRVRSHSASRESRRGLFISYEAVDVDECGVRWEAQAPCQHFCHNYIGGYRCYCRQGYSLHSDGKTCQVAQCGVPEDIENGSYEYLDGEAGTRSGSVVSYRCRQTYYTMVGGADGKYSCQDNGKWMNSVVGETLPSCKPVCGKPQRPPLLIQRIFGGAPARDGNFPWQVYFENRVCGGALLSDAWVLTSASCVQGELRPRMFAGATDRSSAAGWTALEGVEVHVRPGYAKSPVGHDIALVRLRDKVRMGPTMSPICLPRDEVEVGTVGLVSGFGETEHFSQSEVLMFAPVPVVERDNCQGASAPLPLTPAVICAGTGGGADACTGDGGGSLVFKDPLHHDTYFTAGVVSWGQKCGVYGVYTSVRNHLEWIESIMGP
ncbi:complement C1s subcomponent-like [Hemitrygon akajei]|uniref:complement C1s subcomponent-like n=1 Tax=Hemitrygon akajei TaxID=2704970 RepID=UPI003BF9E6D0